MNVKIVMLCLHRVKTILQLLSIRFLAMFVIELSLVVNFNAIDGRAYVS